MNKILGIFAVLALLLCCSSVFAQDTHTFTFGKFGVDSYNGESTGCAEFTTIDGQQPNSLIGLDGAVCVPYGENPWWGLEAPQSWGFPNNGFLTNNITVPQLSAPVFVDPNCNFSTPGCVSYETGTAVFQGYGQGVTVSVTVYFQVSALRSCGRTGCHIRYINNQTNGIGTATYTAN